MTPKTAIEAECRHCKNGQRFHCKSDACALNNRGFSPLRRIKSHCLDCAGSRAEVVSCKGDALTSGAHKCPLWSYRLGTNPALKGKGNIENLRGEAIPSDFDFLPPKNAL